MEPQAQDSALFSHFLQLHTNQLKGLEVPEASCWLPLHKKLHAGDFDLSNSFALDEESHSVVAAKDIPAGSIWPVKHLMRAPHVKDLITSLQRNPGLLLQVAEALQVDSYSDSESESGEAQAKDIELGIAQLFASVRKHLHRAVFVYQIPEQLREVSVHEQQAPNRSHKMRYIPEALAAQMAPGVKETQHKDIQIVPFFWLETRPECPDRVTSIEQICVAWSVSDLKEGEAVTRCRLPLGMGDFSDRAFWKEAYRGEVEPEDWYCDGTQEFLSVLEKHSTGQHSSTTVLKNQSAILLPGCGNSLMGVALWQAGYKHLVQIDYVEAVIDQMVARYAGQYEGLTWMMGDCCSLPQLEGASFDYVLDKAMLDALATLSQQAGSAPGWRQETVITAASDSTGATQQLGPGKDAPPARESLTSAGQFGDLELAGRYLCEMRRLITPHGRFVLMSLRQPERLRGFLGATGWAIEEVVPVQGFGGAYLYTCVPV